MSRSQDLFGLIRGFQIIVNASVKSQEECFRNIWVNSSVREILQNNIKYSEERVKELSKNPEKDIQQIAKFVRESVERTAVVAEGIVKLATASIDTQITEKSQKIKKDLSGVDISSITLKELESILADRNKIRDFNTLEKNSEKPADDIEIKENFFQELGIIENKPLVSKAENELEYKKPTSNMTSDEKEIEQWMKVIQNHKMNESVVKTSETINKQNIELPALSEVAKQRKVPSSRIARLASFGGLFAGLGVGTVNELAKGAFGFGGSTSVKEAVLSPSNTERIVDTLCKVRGAALKIGQILSIQDSNIVSPELAKAFDRVRQAADYMPDWQVENMMKSQFGPNWRDLLQKFDNKPFAAASIGQVHRGTLKDGTEVAVKIQYPGIAQSIESDIDNLVGLLKLWDLFPAGMFIDNIVKVAKRELVWEVDYLREADYTERFRHMVTQYPEYRVPKIFKDITSKSVLTTELLPGVPLDKCFDMSYEHRYFVGKAVLQLCLRELFEFQCMQTDPNWSNFLYDPTTKTLMLIDFGSTRFYTKQFMDNYLKVIKAAVDDKPNEVLTLSRTMGFLTGYESKAMEDAHVSAVMTLGEMFRYQGEYDFGAQNMTKKISHLVPTMIAHRLCPPPEEIYSLHRKLSGVFLLCQRLNIRLACRPMFENLANNYKYDT